MRVKVLLDNILVYEGDILNIPIKNEAIISKSMELFGDDDPCIIHQSYVVKDLLTPIIDYLEGKESFKPKDYSQWDFLDFESGFEISVL
jgi:hypothetical protein